MKFKTRVVPESGFPLFCFVPLIDIMFLLLIFFMLGSSLATQVGVDVKLPKAVTSDMITQEQMIVSVSDENIIYFNGKIISMSELEAQLEILKKRHVPLLIKTNRRASVGRVVDIWDLCRQLGLEKVSIAAGQRD